MLEQIYIIAICILSPLFIMWLTYKYDILNKIGSIILAYALGCILGLTGLIPSTEEVFKLQNNIASASIPFAIPMMLYSANIKAWTKLAPSFIKSLIFGLIGCTSAITVGFLIFGQENSDMYARISGMLTGLYTGGTANLASLKLALNVPDDVYLQVHTYSMVVSAIYLLFVVVFGQKVFNMILPKFDKYKHNDKEINITLENYDNELFYGLFTKANMPNLVKSLVLTLIIIAIGGGIAMLCPEGTFLAVFILIISMLSVLSSLHSKVREIKRTFEFGTYFILVFSVAVSSQISVSMFENIDLTFFMFTVVVTIGALLIHVLLSAIFRVDTDTVLTTSIALTCSPPFVPVMCGALHNKAVLGPGIAVGLFGYAVGTYLGFGLFHMLSAMG